MQKFRDHAYDWIVWAIFAAVPSLIFWQAATSLEEQGVASGGPMENAAFYPRIVASIMVLLLGWLALSLLTGKLRRTAPLERSVGTGKALIMTVLFVLYLIVLPYSGFHIATPIFCFLLFRLLGIPVIRAVAGGIGLSLILAFVFEALLNVVLPVGVFNIALFN